MNVSDTKTSDTDFEDYTITDAHSEGDNGWSITVNEGFSFWVTKTSPIEPRAGMSARFYGKGFGFSVRGLDLDGTEVFYKTTAEHEAEMRRQVEQREQEQKYDFEKKRSDYDRRYRAMPEVFQRRIDKFRSNNPDFRWKFEGYELFCCEQAVAIAEKVKADDLDAFRRLEWKQQKLIVPALSEGHSGNTFGCAVALAFHYLKDAENVVKMYGALAPLVGSEEYGCVPRS